MCILCFVAAYFFIGGFFAAFFAKNFKISWFKILFWPIVLCAILGSICSILLMKSACAFIGKINREDE